MRNCLKFIVLIFLFSTQGICAQTEAYSFFIAGHVYGTPGVENEGFHPPFKAKYSYIQNRDEVEFGVLLGDMVIWGAESKWDNVDADIEELGIPVYKVVGNHDLYNAEIYYNRYGYDTYSSFVYENDLFIILDPNIDNWNISSDQLVFLQNTVSEYAADCDNIFVLVHQLLWWEPEGLYSEIVANSTEGRAEEINFWTQIEPLFSNLDNNVVMCAGDVGAASYASPFMYDKYDNITLLATGMGKGETDNFVVINVSADKDITYDLICLNSEELYCFGELTDYDMYTGNTSVEYSETSAFPNPLTDVLNIVNPDDEILSFQLMSNTGELVLIKTDLSRNQIEINLESIKPGMYYINVICKNSSFVKKIIKI